MSGQVIFDCTSVQKRALEESIREIYDVARPQLIPLILQDVEVTPVFASQTLGVARDGESVFPTYIQVGTSAAYNIANGSGRFAQLFANIVAAGGGDGLPNSDFALSINGSAELVGDPWRVEISADLSQVWRFVRETFSASAQIAWFKLGDSSFTRVMQDLVKSEIVTIKYIEGSRDQKDPGNQLFEQGKLLFESMNQQLAAGEGLFKIEPNPAPPPPPSGGGSVLPWSFSVNGAYQASYFNQTIHWSRELEYVGRTSARIPSSIVIAVTCGHETDQFFFDLGDPGEPCVTAGKIARMQERLKLEKAAQDRVVRDASRDVESGELDKETYAEIINYLGRTSLTEDVQQSGGRAHSFGGHQRTLATRYRRFAGEYTELLRRFE